MREYKFIEFNYYLKKIITEAVCNELIIVYVPFTAVQSQLMHVVYKYIKL